MALTIYTIGSVVRTAVVDSVTSAASGYPKEFLLDHNADTFWRPTTTGDQAIDVDLNFIPGSFTWAIGYLLKNYDTDHSNSGSAKFQPQHSTDDSSYTNLYGAGEFDIADNNEFIRIHDLGAIAMKRYLRFNFTGLATILDIAGIYLFKKYALTAEHELPDRGSYRYPSEIIESPSGRSYGTLYNSNSIQILPRTYKVGTTEWGKLWAAWDASYGNVYPLVLYDGSNYYWAKFMDDEFVNNEFVNTFYNPSVTFLTIPYIPDGELY